MSVFIVHPYEGYNDIPFNCSQLEAQKIDGDPVRIVIDNIMKETYEYRNANIKLTFCDNVLVDTWIPQDPANNEVYLSENPNVDLFNDNVLELLKKEYSYKEAKNKRCILFPDLGICMWGCGERKTKEGKIIIAFSRNRLLRYELFINA